jgi:Zn-dependent M16 (insulinase) family peptidase
MVSFTNQALKGVSRTHQIDLLDKYQVITKADVVEALQKHFLPLFKPTTSVAVVVTAPAKAKDIGDGLSAIGFNVTQKVMEVDPDEMVEGEDTESDSASSSDSRGDH